MPSSVDSSSEGSAWRTGSLLRSAADLRRGADAVAHAEPRVVGVDNLGGKQDGGEGGVPGGVAPFFFLHEWTGSGI